MIREKRVKKHEKKTNLYLLMIKYKKMNVFFSFCCLKKNFLSKIKNNVIDKIDILIMFKTSV